MSGKKYESINQISHLREKTSIIGCDYFFMGINIWLFDLILWKRGINDTINISAVLIGFLVICAGLFQITSSIKKNRDTEAVIVISLIYLLFCFPFFLFDIFTGLYVVIIELSISIIVFFTSRKIKIRKK